ncbi:MAG: hypothetical protein EXR98_19565 [Gemmataceae bacterium]|nr:hypothetical protein [Gemmataceae bacterium]
MARHRLWLTCSATVSLMLAVVQLGLAQTDVPPVIFTGPLSHPNYLQISKPSETKAACCKVYSLADLGDDPNLCKWIADTIPDVIQPGSWVYAGGTFGTGEAKLTISYFAPAKVLVINHTPAVHAQVDELLQNIKKSLPQPKAAANRTMHDPKLLPAQFTVPDNTRPIAPVQSYQSSYPVPYPPQAPKHLFHFIIRYEGAGVIDKNVVNMIKAQNSQSTGSQNQYSSDPMIRMEQSMIDSVPFRQMHEEWRKYWQKDQPTQIVPAGQYLRHPPQYLPVSPPNTMPATSAPRTSNVPMMPPADPAPSATLPNVQPTLPLVPSVPLFIF